ncbi:MAG: DUF3175 domain-containing protein, partial [Rhodanobacteraceae bacterium]
NARGFDKPQLQTTMSRVGPCLFALHPHRTIDTPRAPCKTENSDALDLKERVFTLDDPKAVAHSLMRSARASKRRKADPFRSAMSMLTFYINRAGDNLPAGRRRLLEQAKDELRDLRKRSDTRKRPT